MSLWIQGLFVPWVYVSNDQLSPGFMDPESNVPWVYGSNDLLSHGFIDPMNCCLESSRIRESVFFCESITLAVVSLEISRIIRRVFPQDIYHVIYYSQNTIHRINPSVQGLTNHYVYHVSY